MRILIIDDEPLLCETLLQVLSQDHECTATSHTKEALARIQTGERFDLILCDLMMPEMTGIDLCERLEIEAPDQASRMLFVTGGAFTPRASEFVQKHAAAIIEKPFTSSEIRERVSSALLEHQQRR